MLEIGKIPSVEGRQMVVKIQIRKSNGKIVLSEAEEEFFSLFPWVECFSKQHR